MMSRFPFIPFVAVVAVVCASTAAAQEVASSTFYPTAIGTQWVYSAGPVEILERVVAYEKIGEDWCARIETVFNGKPISHEHIAIRPDGIYRVAVAGQQVQPAFRLVKLPPRDKEQWAIASKLGEQMIAGTFTLGESQVETPAGKYRTLTATGTGFKIGEAEIEFVYHFAPGVGKVMQVTKIAGQKDVVLQLKEFKLGSGASQAAVPGTVGR
ncbi:MAG: hypothetical protein KDA58_15035 [Planctomycetaceae bacterium]|nr:hypothetical protein [Planctomycetaceae bacterium]